MAGLQLQLVACFLFFLCTNFITFVYSISFNAIVSLDGRGNFKSIGAAIAAAPNNSHSRFYIHVKSGTYKEHIDEVEVYKTFIALIGNNAATTIIDDHRSGRTGFGTAESATFVVKGNNFMAQSITFKNSAGPGSQAVALFNQNTNNSAYYKCVFLGYQDTLFINGKRLFFKDCEIYGTVDFIFGNALALFQDCKIYARRLPNTTVTITAQSKETHDQDSGFCFQNCRVMASPELGSRKINNFDVYLGRPWRNYSTVIFMQSFLDSVVNPSGWSSWPPTPLNLLFYAEFNNSGPGANLTGRVKWPSFHVIKYRREAIKFTVNIFINGTNWLPETRIPFRPGL